MNKKFTNVYLEILNTTLQLVKLNWAVFSFASCSRIFFVSGSSLICCDPPPDPCKTIRTQCPPVRRSLFARIGQCEVTSRYDWSRRFIMSFSSQTRVLHVVDLFSLFCGILTSFLAKISLVVTVVIPHPKSSLTVKRSVKRSSVRKLKFSTARCLHPQRKLQNCFPKAQWQYGSAKTAWVITVLALKHSTYC